MSRELVTRKKANLLALDLQLTAAQWHFVEVALLAGAESRCVVRY